VAIATSLNHVHATLTLDMRWRATRYFEERNGRRERSLAHASAPIGSGAGTVAIDLMPCSAPELLFPRRRIDKRGLIGAIHRLVDPAMLRHRIRCHRAIGR
jgi:hypothetical protein